MNLTSMILTGNTSKETYKETLKNISMHEVFHASLTDVKPLKNQQSVSHVTKHSLFSLALYSLDIPFLEAVYDLFGHKVNYKTSILLKRGYRDEEHSSIHSNFHMIINENTKSYYGLDESSDLLKSVCLKYMNQFSYFSSGNDFYFKEQNYRADNKLNELFKYAFHLKSKPILAHLFYYSMANKTHVLEYMFKKGNMNEINHLFSVFDNFATIIKENTIFNAERLKQATELPSLKQYLHTHKALFDVVTGFSKKMESVTEEKIDFILSVNKDSILKELNTYAEDLIGKSDIAKIITTDKNKKYVMAYSVLKNVHQMVNKLFDYGYIINDEEIALLMANKVKESVKDEHSSLLINNVDELSVMVKAFEKPLFKRLKTNVKNLKNFLESLTPEKKEYLFSYYDQFQETHLSLYKASVDSVDINNKDISAIDYCLFNRYVEQTAVLIQHNFPFSEEQIYKIGEMMFMFSSFYQSDFIDDYHQIQKVYLDFMANLPAETIKTIMLKNSIKTITCGYDMMDGFSEYCVSKINLTKNEIDAMLNTNVFNAPLLDKILKDNQDYFFNKSAMLNFIKSNVHNFDAERNKHLNPDDNMPQTFQNIVIYILKQDRDYNEIASKMFGKARAQEIWSKYEREMITSTINQEEKEEEVDKVRIRRRI